MSNSLYEPIGEQETCLESVRKKNTKDVQMSLVFKRSVQTSEENDGDLLKVRSP